MKIYRKLIDRIDYKDEQTKKRMEYLKITAIEDINKKLIRRNKNEEKSIGLWVVIITVLILGLGAAGGYLYFLQIC